MKFKLSIVHVCIYVYILRLQSRFWMSRLLKFVGRRSRIERPSCHRGSVWTQATSSRFKRCSVLLGMKQMFYLHRPRQGGSKLWLSILSYSVPSRLHQVRKAAREGLDHAEAAAEPPKKNAKGPKAKAKGKAKAKAAQAAKDQPSMQQAESTGDVPAPATAEPAKAANEDKPAPVPAPGAKAAKDKPSMQPPESAGDVPAPADEPADATEGGKKPEGGKKSRKPRHAEEEVAAAWALEDSCSYQVT